MNPPLWDFSNYMTIESLGVASVAFTMKVEYTKDGRVWETLEAYESLGMKGECVSFKHVLEPGEVVGHINLTGRCNLRGNCLSLIFGDEASGKNDIHLYPNCFLGTFSNKEIINIDKGFLPATTLADHCYQDMFSGCTSLVNAPDLPATTLANYCYYNMFYRCTSLTTAPELPATTLANSCYATMFQGCTSLTTAPELPATTLENYCYNGMFRNCTSLTTAPELPATTLANYCYFYMFYGCTSLTTAPELPATTLTKNCYTNMFNSCSKLNYIKMLSTDISASSCLTNWVGNVASTGTFVKHPYMTTLSTGKSGIPSGWTVVNDGEE